MEETPLVEKIAKPKTLDPNGWYIKLHDYIGWGYSKHHFCPFFWQTAAGVCLLPFIWLFRLFISGCKFGISTCAYVLSSIYTFVCYLTPHSAFNYVADKLSQFWAWYEETLEIREIEGLAAKYNDQPEFASFAAHYQAKNKQKLSQAGRQRLTEYAKPVIEKSRKYETSKYGDQVKDPGFRVWMDRNGLISQTSGLKDAYLDIENQIKKAKVIRQAWIGGFLALFGLIIGFALAAKLAGVATLTTGAIFVLKCFAGLAAISALVAAIVIGGPLIWGYFKHVVLQKYCPAIEWHDPTKPIEPEETEHLEE